MDYGKNKNKIEIEIYSLPATHESCKKRCGFVMFVCGERTINDDKVKKEREKDSLRSAGNKRTIKRINLAMS